MPAYPPFSKHRSSQQGHTMQETSANAHQSEDGKVSEFNLWCALNDWPFRLSFYSWPDGFGEWSIEVNPGSPQERIAYGTAVQDPNLAAAIAYAFVEGVDWGFQLSGEEPLDPDEARFLEAQQELEFSNALETASLALSSNGLVMKSAGTSPVRTTKDLDQGAQDKPIDQNDLQAVEDVRAKGQAPNLDKTREDRIESLGGGEDNQTTTAKDTLYRLPDHHLLQEAVSTQTPEINELDLADKTRKLETVLKNFRIRGEIMEVHIGPVVTLFELEPVPGTKSSTVINLSDDIARSMSAVTTRIALVPGRSVIGIELPNESRQTVYLRDILSSSFYSDSKAKLPLVLGKNIGGDPVVVDLAKMPHLLIAGTTGSGKSVGINAMILSLLYRLRPEECRMILIDPKMLEFSVYDGIPHLLAPVVTDPQKAVQSLKWVVREMESRYRSMSLMGVRNIDGYNEKVSELAARGEKVTRKIQTGFDPERREPIFEEQELPLERLPYIVVVVDEMADLMLVAGKEIETLIQRLAQMARAAGIHLIMATQRPSVDVITGTIKANFPTRVSFQVTSRIDSRTILGESGAEQLLGQGDMLYMQAGGRITRVHGPFVSEREVEDVVAHLKAQQEPDYLYDITEMEDMTEMDTPAAAENPEGEEGDLYEQALSLILREGKVSVSFIQRHLQIGYNRAAKVVERMEYEGIVGPPNHVGKREILRGRR